MSTIHISIQKQFFSLKNFKKQIFIFNFFPNGFIKVDCMYLCAETSDFPYTKRKLLACARRIQIIRPLRTCINIIRA